MVMLMCELDTTFGRNKAPNGHVQSDYSHFYLIVSLWTFDFVYANWTVLCVIRIRSLIFLMETVNFSELEHAKSFIWQNHCTANWGDRASDSLIIFYSAMCQRWREKSTHRQYIIIMQWLLFPYSRSTRWNCDLVIRTGSMLPRAKHSCVCANWNEMFGADLMIRNGCIAHRKLVHCI